ncbi:MAG: hypothetical protein ISN28_01100 [Ectothiorhodospiraceae bacterium AqS1]|nr:hypothetical protein [Ectothiorhodospiraceae bacterium AqS1]
MVIVLSLLYLTAVAPALAGAPALPGGAPGLARSEPLGRLAAAPTPSSAAIEAARADAAPLLGPSRSGPLPEGVKSCKTLAASA